MLYKAPSPSVAIIKPSNVIKIALDTCPVPAKADIALNRTIIKEN